MGNKARGVGKSASEKLRSVDDILAHIYRVAEPQAKGERILEVEVEMNGLRINKDVSEARRLVNEVLSMKE